MSFVHLKLRSHYSLQDGLGTVDSWVDRAAELGFEAMAMTESDNLFSAIKFYRRAMAKGIKPVIGVDVMVAPPPGSKAVSRVVLLCMHMEGMRNLNQMLTAAWRQQQPPVISRELLEKHAEGLIALSGMDGELARLGAGSAKSAQLVAWWQKLFPGNLCLAVQRAGLDGEESWIGKAVAMGAEHGIPLVATNDCRFVREEDYDAHAARVCILSGETLSDSSRQKLYGREQYLRSDEQMRDLFADIPSALENSALIAQRCNLEIEFDKPRMPHFPSGDQTQDELLRQQAQGGLDDFLQRHPKLEPEPYQERLQEELGVILGTGYAGYFLIVADFIRWAREQGIPVGPGRGSGGGSLVAFVTGITSIDPIAYDLLFERFLNKERVSLPDFDIDFCMHRRDEVIDYVTSRYGSDRVAQIITYGAMNAKAAIRDVTRILGQPYMLGDRLAKQVPPDLDMSLDKALSQVPTLREEYDRSDEVRSVIDLARQLEGSVRHPGRHAGGLVISPEPLVHYMPLYSDGENDGMLTQFDMHDVEGIGLVKFDFLGLKTLTIMEHSLGDINRLRAEQEQPPLQLQDLPMNDKAAYEMIMSSNTLAVFQLESYAMKRLIGDLQPSCFDDMVALVALMRPGPLESGMTKDYIERKHGRQPIRTLHPILKPVLRSTYGVVLYQEQVMEIARTMSGFSLGMADLLRRAMGKKKPEEMAMHQGSFVEGAVKNGINKGLAENIFSKIEEFAGYGFNKSHSVAYALISYHTAWLKAHYTAVYMAAVMSVEQDNVERLMELRRELKELGVKVLPPDINLSSDRFEAKDSKIRYSLAAIRGVGRGVVAAIVQEKEKGGAFSGLHDFCCRMDFGKGNRRVLEALAQAGALDCFNPDRATLFKNVPSAIAFAAQIAANSESGADDMFGLGSSQSQAVNDVTELVVADEPWSEEHLLSCELQVLGDYFSGHPVQVLRRDLECLKLDDLAGKFKDREEMRFVAEVCGVFRGKGGKFVDVLVEDEHRRAKLRFGSSNDIYIPGAREMVYVTAKMDARSGNDDQNDLMLRPSSIQSLDQMYDSYAMLSLSLHSDGDQINGKPGSLLLRQLRDIIAANPGASPVAVQWQRGELEAKMLVDSALQVRISRDLLRQLRGLLAADAVQVRYHGNVSPGENAAPAAAATAA